MTKYGFTTGCYDFVHQGHFNILKFMKSRCDTLIIGLTTDERCTAEKRKPIMNFDQRRSILENCKYVDLVIANSGESKEIIYKKIKFDILFIGDDYFDKEEYVTFNEKYPKIKLLYIPRTQNISTSDYYTELKKRIILNELKLINVALNGPILGISDIVCKSVCCGYSEYVENPTLEDTADKYNIGLPEPRNWRWEEGNNFPNIPCINIYRELLISICLKKYKWYPVLDYSIWYNSETFHKSSNNDKISKMIEERRYPLCIYRLTQKNVGNPLSKWLPNNKDKIKNVKKSIREITNILKSEGIVHGDIHEDNLCIDEKTEMISLIDFGWCLWKGFNLSTEEQNLLNDRIMNDYDYNSFIKNLNNFIC